MSKSEFSIGAAEEFLFACRDVQNAIQRLDKVWEKLDKEESTCVFHLIDRLQEGLFSVESLIARAKQLVALQRKGASVK